MNVSRDSRIDQQMSRAQQLSDGRFTSLQTVASPSVTRALSTVIAAEHFGMPKPPPEWYLGMTVKELRHHLADDHHQRVAFGLQMHESLKLLHKTLHEIDGKGDACRD